MSIGRVEIFVLLCIFWCNVSDGEKNGAETGVNRYGLAQGILLIDADIS